MADKSKKTICLFNCDNTYKLDVVEAFLMEMNRKHGLNLAIGKHNFRLQQMADICENTIPQTQMDCAIFALHAHESRLSINEDKAGIGYAKIYRALLEATNEKVLIVIGGDDNYKEEEDEGDKSVISRWARRKVASQFTEEYLDGRKSFIFSWNKSHREIHEEALLHYFDPSKNGIKFEYKPREPKKNQEPVLAEPRESSAIDCKVSRGDSKEVLLPEEIAEREKPVVKTEAVDERPQQEGNGERGRTVENETSELTRSREQPHYGAMNQDYPKGTILLETRLRRGEISYKKWHIVKQQIEWQPSETQVSSLRDWHQLTENLSVQFVAADNNGGIKYIVFPTPWWRKCLDCFKMCFSCKCPPCSCKCKYGFCKHLRFMRCFCCCCHCDDD